MAIVRFDGERVLCTPVRQLPDGTWQMLSLQHTARLVPGTEFIVHQDDICDMGKAETSPTMIGRPDHALSTLMTAMAAERETLPTPAEVIRGNPPIAHDAPGKVEGA